MVSQRLVAWKTNNLSFPTQWLVTVSWLNHIKSMSSFLIFSSKKLSQFSSESPGTSLGWSTGAGTVAWLHIEIMGNLCGNPCGIWFYSWLTLINHFSWGDRKKIGQNHFWPFLAAKSPGMFLISKRKVVPPDVDPKYREWGGSHPQCA